MSATSMRRCMSSVLSSLSRSLGSCVMRPLIPLNTSRNWRLSVNKILILPTLKRDLDAFKVAFAKNYNSASVNFGKAIDEIDKAIKRMEEVKKFLTTSENQLRLANNKLDDVSVKNWLGKIQPWKLSLMLWKENNLCIQLRTLPCPWMENHGLCGHLEKERIL